MIRLTEEMRDAINPALARGMPCLLVTAWQDGWPAAGFRGSMMVYDDQHLAYWERTRGREMASLRENPRVLVIFRDPVKRMGWKFYGVATIYEEGPIREQVMARTVPEELERDPERRGVAVLIRVDRITTLGGRVLQERGPGE
ncbi:hypothetical protein HRbin23_00385 [bacterium HR23]|nr:hypothetical protein HRbin23_00385 [bacterium HR23]